MPEKYQFCQPGEDDDGDDVGGGVDDGDGDVDDGDDDGNIG